MRRSTASIGAPINFEYINAPSAGGDRCETIRRPVQAAAPNAMCWHNHRSKMCIAEPYLDCDVGPKVGRKIHRKTKSVPKIRPTEDVPVSQNRD